MLQDVKISTNLKNASISKVRFCKIKEEDCKKGTYLTYFDESSNIKKQFACLECDPMKHKIIKLHKYFRNIPFDLEEHIGEFHRNIQSPYIVCGDVANVVKNCEFYFDNLIRQSKYGKYI